jgi:hypothetical protein
MCFPEARGTRYRISSHADIFPTVFDFMGAQADAPFMSGKSLLEFDEDRDFAVARGTVSTRDASARYLVVRGDTRLRLLQTSPPELQKLETLAEEPVAPPPPGEIARGIVAFVQSAELRFPVAGATVQHP